MLRIFVVALFAFNILILGLAASKSGPAPADGDLASSIRTDVETIHLLGEVTDDADLLASSRHCFTLGPMLDSDLFEITRGEIAEKAVAISDRSSEALVELGYWVYLSPFDDAEQAQSMLTELQQAGAGDVAIVAGRDGQSVISLGYYAEEANAKARAEEIENLGYQPKSIIRRETQERFWLDYELEPGVELGGLAANRSQQPVYRRAIPCIEKPSREYPATPLVAEGDANTRQASTGVLPES